MLSLDLETTSLDPATGRVRTINIAGSDPAGCAVIDCDRLKGGFTRIAPLFHEKPVHVFYAGFERKWFDDHGGCISAYVERYGSADDPDHYGSGGELIFAADKHALEVAEDAVTRLTGGH